MTRYAFSRSRILLLTVLLVAIAWTVRLYAQDIGTTPDAAAPVTEQAPEAPSLIQMIMDHMDAVFFTIAILSVIALTLIIQAFIKNREAVVLPPQTVQLIRTMIQNRQFNELMEFTERDPSFVSRVLNPALKRAPSFSAMKEAMETAIGEQTAEQFRKIEYLNIIGNLGPLLGLLGTVLGMIYAFQAVAATGGQADVGALSNGISVALVHTFLGLMLAVPCLAAFGVLRTIVDRLTVRGALIAEELLMMIKPAERPPVAQAAQPRAAQASQASPLAAPAPLM